MNPLNALRSTVARLIASGAPVFTEQPAARTTERAAAPSAPVYLVRDLHAAHPDDYTPGTLDILRTAPDGTRAYTEDYFYTRDAAEVAIAGFEAGCAASWWPLSPDLEMSSSADERSIAADERLHRDSTTAQNQSLTS